MKRRAWALPLALLTAALLFPCPAAAETVAEKSYVVVMEDGVGRIKSEPDAAAFWELPQLAGGQSSAEGTLRIINGTAQTLDILLAEIGLPYGDQEALAYLDAVWITIRDGSSVLYDGTYSRIAEPGGLALRVEDLLPGAGVTLSVALHCSFRYEGESDRLGASIPWVFAAAEALPSDQVSPPSTPVWAVILLATAVVLVAVCAVLGTVGITRRTRR